jgi:hypothetical protein
MAFEGAVDSGSTWRLALFSRTAIDWLVPFGEAAD